MIAVPALLLLALLGQPQQRTYTWRDAAGQTHITNTPPPPGAQVVEPPPPPAVQLEQATPSVPQRRGASPDGRELMTLNPAQQQAWEAIDQRLAKARAQGDRHTMEAVVDSLMHDCLWGKGLWILPALPALAVLLLGLMGWWLALGLRPGPRMALVAGFLALGLAFGHLLLGTFLYHPQASRLRHNLELLEGHLGTGKALRSEQRTRLKQHYQALERAAEPLQPPWRFPREVNALEASIKQVMVEP